MERGGVEVITFKEREVVVRRRWEVRSVEEWRR